MPYIRSLGLLLLCTACSSATPPTAPDAAPVAPGITLPSGNGVTARFVKTQYDVTGTATVRIANGVGVIDLSGDFSVSQTPGPYLYLNTTNNPNTGRPLRIANLRGKSGAQQYVFSVPADVRYSWVVIWCDPFNLPMAEASIPPTP
jgi:hypothetical protein